MQQRLSLRTSIVMLLLAGLSACGGGNSDSSTASSSTTTPSTSVTTPTPAPVPVIVPRSTSITGVAATGAPLLGAQVRIVDATGTAVTLQDPAGSTIASVKTSTADGSYKAVLASPATLPLLIQAAGVDGSGVPVVLHSVLATAATPLLSHITPASEAMLAMVLGGSPRSIFSNTGANAQNIALLSNTTALNGASDQLKSILKNNFSDIKLPTGTTVAALDLVRDPNFSANRTGLDAVLEGVRIMAVRDASAGEQLQVSNKFVTPGTVEVTVNLATAAAELLKGTSGNVASAVTSTLKATTSPLKTSLPNLETIDALSATINSRITQRTTGAYVDAVTSVPASYLQDGRTKNALKTKFADYTTKNLQLGRWQILGCADDPYVPGKTCIKFRASALVVNSVGDVVDVFSDTLSIDTAKPPNWILSGNGRSNEVRASQVAQATFNLDGSQPANGALPASGLQLAVRAQDPSANRARTVVSASVQVPSGYGVRLVYCGIPELCVSTGSTSVAATGELSDALLQKTPGWVGSQDAALGAKLAVTVTPCALPCASTPVAATAETVNVYLTAKPISDLGIGLFPKLDTPLSIDSLNHDLLLSWGNWAASNPDMRVFTVRLVTPVANSTPLIQDFAPTSVMKTSLFIPAPASAITASQLWLGAVDSLGRSYYSQLKSTP
jgi:hypothetical protein